MNHILKLSFVEKSLLFKTFLKMHGSEWEKKGDIYEATITHQLAKSEKETLGKIVEQLTGPLFPPEGTITPTKKDGGVVE